MSFKAPLSSFEENDRTGTGSEWKSVALVMDGVCLLLRGGEQTILQNPSQTVLQNKEKHCSVLVQVPLRTSQEMLQVNLGLEGHIFRTHSYTFNSSPAYKTSDALSSVLFPSIISACQATVEGKGQVPFKKKW